MMQKKINCLWVFVFAVLLAWDLTGNTAARLLPQEQETIDLERMCLGARFSQVIQHVEKKKFQRLLLKEKLLFIECLARTGNGSQAEKKLTPILASHPSDSEVLAAAGGVALSLGRLEEARRHINQALELKPGLKQALLVKALLLLYYREFNQAQEWYEKLVMLSKNTGSPWADSDLLFLVGLDVYRSNQDPQRLDQLYKTHARRKKKISKSQYRDLISNHRMYRRASKKSWVLFQVETKSDKVVIPFNIGERDSRINTISLTAGGKTFNVLLDTGNATGWIVHSRELNELLNPVNGGRTITMIGTESGFLDGYRQYYKAVDFNGFQVYDVNGIYVPKPHPDYLDANLNPAFIRNRVVTIDFIKNQLILRTKERFTRDQASVQQTHGVYRLPWYGYKSAFVPVTVLEKKGLAVIETGAQDVALKLNFVQELGLTLTPRVKYLATGQVTRYHQAPVMLFLGNFCFRREAADIWPFSRFYNRLTGLSADVFIGPEAFRGKYVVSFDPFDKKVVLERTGAE
jgi:tetratricopeptide (TPR) repeat protein